VMLILSEKRENWKNLRNYFLSLARHLLATFFAHFGVRFFVHFARKS